MIGEQTTVQPYGLNSFANIYLFNVDKTQVKNLGSCGAIVA